MLFAQTEPLDGPILDIQPAWPPFLPDPRHSVGPSHPFMFLTGYDIWLVPVDFRDSSLITKPFEATEMKKALGQMLGVSQTPVSPADKIVWH